MPQVDAPDTSQHLARLMADGQSVPGAQPFQGALRRNLVL